MANFANDYYNRPNFTKFTCTLHSFALVGKQDRELPTCTATYGVYLHQASWQVGL